ncbi:MAG: TetR/AcrR family transcriptional regulator [Anaerolineae bacterium]|nr:TetR/AcrR family transcriptional regulator [Anaerolineae bacterium]
MEPSQQTPESSAQNRRQRRIARRRSEILAAAAEVFAERGYAGTTTRAIAEAADVAEGTLYNYFGGKREILLAVANEADGPMAQALLDAGRLESREAMTVLFERAFDISEARLPFLRTLLTASWTDDSILHQFISVRLRRVYDALQTFIAERVESGAFRPIDPALGARVAMGMFIGLILPVLRGVEPLPAPHERRALAETIVDLLLDGVRIRLG